MTRLLHFLLDTFAPTNCGGCEAVGSLLCVKCRAALTVSGASPREVFRGDFRGLSLFALEQPVSSIIIAFKDRGRTALGGFLARRLTVPLQFFDHSEFQLVAIPSRRSSIAKRGFDHAQLLVRHLSRASGAPVGRGVLRLARQTADQRELSADQRRDNLVGSMLAVPSALPVVLVDDVVTSGASVLEARRALQAAGIVVLGFITIAETLPKRLRKS